MPACMPFMVCTTLSSSQRRDYEFAVKLYYWVHKFNFQKPNQTRDLQKSFKQSRLTTFPMTISLFTTPRYTLTAVDMLICMPIPRMLFQPYWAWVLPRSWKVYLQIQYMTTSFSEASFLQTVSPKCLKSVKEFQNPSGLKGSWPSLCMLKLTF